MGGPVVIIGAGQAGQKAAETLRKLGFGDEIVMVGAERHPPYQRPPLSKKFLKGEIPSEQLWLQGADFFETQGIRLITGAEARHIDAAGRRVALSDGTELSYAKLLLATGCRPRVLPIPGAHLAGIHVLRTIDDVSALSAALVEARNVAIIGGGYVGLEVAAVLASLGKHPTVIEAQDRLLKRVAGPDVSQYFTDLHRNGGVEILLGTSVAGLVGETKIEGVALGDGRLVPADLALMAVGGAACAEIAAGAGVACQDGILVDATCATSVPDIYAAGDCTRFPSARYGRQIRLESVQNANDQAKAAAMAMAGQPVAYDPVPWFWSDQFDTKLQIAGLSQDYDRVTVDGDPAKGSFSVCYWQGDKLIAVDAINDPRAYMRGRRQLEEQGGAQGASRPPRQRRQ